MLSKEDFLLDPSIIFLNHGSFGALPRVLFEEQQRWAERVERQPVLFFREAPELLRQARVALGDYIGADADDLVYVVNSTFGVNVVAQALRDTLKEGDEILMTDHEYGACDRAWRYHHRDTGVNIVRASIPMPVPPYGDLADLIWADVTERTKVLFISHITAPSAILLPVKELCIRARERGILTVVDGSHIPGHMPLDLGDLGADIYTANCHKWMCTPIGSAFLWIRRDVQERIGPLVVSWGWQAERPGISRFIDEHEYLGTRDLTAFLTVPAAIRWMHSQEWPTVLAVSRSLREEGMRLLCAIPGIRPMLSDADDDVHMMGAVILPDHVDPVAMQIHLYDHDRIEVVIHYWLGVPILRFSVHAHTSASDIEALAAAVRRYVA